MSIPDSFLNMMLPSKISSFYKTLLETVNKSDVRNDDVFKK